MAELLDRVARQQTLLDAWHDLRERARHQGKLDSAITAFEPHAAKRLAQLSEAVSAGIWRPSPVTPVSIPKSSGGQRQLGIPSLEDRIVERAVLDVLDPIVDPELLPWSFAYRRGLGVQDAIRALLEARDGGARWVARVDNSDCFDQIPRSRLLDRLDGLLADPDLLELIRPLVYRPIRGQEGSTPTGLHQARRSRRSSPTCTWTPSTAPCSPTAGT